MIKKEIVLHNLPLHFVDFITPGKSLNEQLEYGARVIVPQDNPKRDELVALFNQVKQENFGDEPAHIPLRYADNDDKIDTEKYPDMAGSLFFNARSKYAPQIRGLNNELATEAEKENYIYSGMVAHVQLGIVGLTHAATKKHYVKANITAVRLTGQGNRIGVSSSEDAFADAPMPTATEGAVGRTTTIKAFNSLDDVRRSSTVG